jgi:hypothetical protein
MRSARTKAVAGVAGGVAGYYLGRRTVRAGAGGIANRVQVVSKKLRALGELGVEQAKHALESLPAIRNGAKAPGDHDL